MSAVELKDKIMNLTRKQEIFVLRAVWDLSINGWVLFEYYSINANILDEDVFTEN